MKKTNLLALIALAPIMSFAATTVPAPKTTTQVKPRLSSASSMQNRVDKKFIVDAELVGFKYGSKSTSLEFGYYLTNDIILSLTYSGLDGYDYSTDSDDPEEIQKLEEEDGDGYALGLESKFFLGNTFYIKPGAYYRKMTYLNGSSSWSADYSNGSWLYTSYEVDYLRFTDVGLSLKIGNQWQWDKFTMGCDWFGYSTSVSMIEEEGNLSQSDLPQYTLLNFYIGASF